MTIKNRLIATAASALVLGAMLGLAPAAVTADESSAVDAGKKLAFNRKKGNCLACHQIAGGKLAGNIGPPLVAMKARFPDKAKLRAQIFDPRKANPNTVMPPFGPHAILSDKEIDQIVEFIYTL